MPWYDLGFDVGSLSGGLSAWDVFQVADIVLLVVAAAIAAFLAGGLFGAQELTSLGAIAGGGAAVGMSVPFESLEYVGYGNYVAVGASIVALAASVLAYLASRARGRPPAAAPAPPAPAAWHPDPSGGARERLWSGERWTHETRD